jgi:transposase InsO family protein
MTNNGTEYTNDEFKDFCEQYGIKRHFIVRKTPHQNGVAERMNRSIADRARCLRLNAGLAKIFWANAVSMTCYLINRSPRVALDGKVVDEVWTGNEVDYSGLRVFVVQPMCTFPVKNNRSLIQSLDIVSFSDMGKGLNVTSFGIRRQTRR